MITYIRSDECAVYCLFVRPRIKAYYFVLIHISTVGITTETYE